MPIVHGFRYFSKSGGAIQRLRIFFMSDHSLAGYLFGLFIKNADEGESCLTPVLLKKTAEYIHNPMTRLMSYMPKKCERCSTPALDDHSVFCNRCGSPVIEEPKITVPVCSRCKSPAPNNEVLFCNRCGTEYPPPEPEHTYPLCPRCGNLIFDDLSEFCNRCGAPVHEVAEPKIPLCSRCGNPAPDADALFCNKCGTAYTNVPVQSIPLCPQCGHTIPDDQSQFCNRCGASTGTEPVNKIPVCRKCGATAPDADTLFCNRCGTAFIPPGKPQKPVHVRNHMPAPATSVKISQKKQVPAVVVPDDLWDPVPDEEYPQSSYPLPVTPPASYTKKQYAHLPLVADEMAGRKGKDESIVISGNTKKYSHLPMIADELKEKQSPRIEIESPYYPGSPKEKKTGKPKKGFFDLLKK
jgi:ribosomal protein L40E